MAMTIVETRAITGGVDTHLDVHVAAALDANGGVVGIESFPTTTAGYKQLFDWLAGFGELARVGVEGTGAYGAGLARFLHAAGIEVIEVDRPNRQARRRQGKSDPLDAVEAARAALSGRARAIAKTADGHVEAIRALVVAKRSARDMRIKMLNQIRHLGFTAPDQLRERFRGGVGTPVWGRPRSRVLRQGHPLAAQPWRQPPSQPRALADRVHTHGIRAAHARIRATPHRRRAHQAGDHARAQALRRARDLP